MQIRLALEDGVPIDTWLTDDMYVQQIYEIRIGLYEGLDVSIDICFRNHISGNPRNKCIRLISVILYKYTEFLLCQIAVYHPAEEGTDGQNVFGEVLHANKVCGRTLSNQNFFIHSSLTDHSGNCIPLVRTACSATGR